MAAVWRPISASVCQVGGAMTAPVHVAPKCGGCSVTSSATVATTAPAILQVGCVPAPLACSLPTAFSPAPLATMGLPAGSSASAMGHPVIPRLELASVLQGKRGPAVVCPVSRALLASCALSPLLAKTGASSKFIRAPAAVHLAGWALFAPCPAQRASMDPTVPRNVAATTVASVTDSLGSATVPRATQVIGVERNVRWAASGRTVTAHATAPQVRTASLPTVHVCANTASPGTAAPSASAPMAYMASAARQPAPATRSTASGGSQVGAVVQGP